VQGGFSGIAEGAKATEHEKRAQQAIPQNRAKPAISVAEAALHASACSHSFSVL
jgi:hypothetical protein